MKVMMLVVMLFVSLPMNAEIYVIDEQSYEHDLDDGDYQVSNTFSLDEEGNLIPDPNGDRDADGNFI